MPTTSLADALNLFDPQRPLQTEELDAFYVARPHAPLEPMKTYLRVADQPVKILFSGHRGSGKSTELTRLARDLANEFFIVTVSARSLNPADLSYADVVLASAAALFRTAGERARGARIPPRLWKQVLDLLEKEIASETTITSPTSGSLALKVSALVVTLEGKYSREATTRKTVRERLLPRINDLIEQMNEVIREVEDSVRRRVLLIFEDIDKTDLAHARDLFFEHATTLNSPACRIIYTFPIALCYSTEFTERLGDYSRHFLLPNVNLLARDGQKNPPGHSALIAVVTRRVSERLFDPGALEAVIEGSGGLMRDLVRMVGDGALSALTEGSDRITTDMIQQVADDMGNSYRRLLEPAHYVALRAAGNSKQITPDETVRQLLGNLSLLEYRNDIAWCDVHPVVRPLL